jgi:hypothetical protein
MTRRERFVLGIGGLIGFGTIWYYTESMAAGWAFLAGAMLLVECADALARRLNEILLATSGRENIRP